MLYLLAYHQVVLVWISSDGNTSNMGDSPNDNIKGIIYLQGEIDEIRVVDGVDLIVP